MTSVFCHPLDKELDASQAERRVRLFGPASMGICGIGTRMEWAFKRLDLGVSQRAYDFLSIAMAVMAADAVCLSAGYCNRWFRSRPFVKNCCSRPRFLVSTSRQSSKNFRFFNRRQLAD